MIFDNLTTLIFMPVLFALVLLFLPNDNNKLIHRFAQLASGFLFVASVYLWCTTSGPGVVTAVSHPWLPMFGINYALQADNLSWTMVLLTTFLVFVSVIASKTSIEKRLKLYYSLLFLITTSLLGVFMARDLFLFFLFYELELIPMYLLIAIWGGLRREYASIKFALYTLLGSIFMFAAIVGLFYFSLHTVGGHPTFAFADMKMLASSLAVSSQVLLFLGFFIAFAVKLPMVPFHTWLPDAHVEAPTPVSMLLAGIMLKMGAYGMVRICFDMFPQAALTLAPYLVLFGVINIIYTAGIAMVQSDLKKLIAYSSVSHMGFVLVGLGALNPIGFTGATFQMVSHGLISAGLFMMVGCIYNRTHTRQIADMGGLAKVMPAVYFFGLFLAMASLGLPLLAGFPAESLVFYGAFLSKAFSSINFFGTVLPLSIQLLTIIAGVGVVLAAAYLLLMIKRVFTGNIFPKWETLTDMVPSEAFVFVCLTILTIGVGFFPMKLSEQFEPQMTEMAKQYQALLPADKPEPKAAAVSTPINHISQNLSQPLISKGSH